MPFTYDPTTIRGQVRLIITDTSAVVAEQIYQDNEIDAFLALNGQDVFLAAAQALDTIASSEVLVQKCITLMDLSTNGAAVAQALHAHAQVLRQQVADSASVDWAEWDVGVFSAREIRRKAAIRNG